MRTLIAFLLLTTMAHAESCGNIVQGPPEFDHVYAGKLTIHVVSWWDIADICMRKGAGPGDNACSVRRAAACDVWIPQVGPADVSLRDQQCDFFHERAHCNGWGADHRGAHFT